VTTVACVWVRGHVPFTAEYVVRLAAMVQRWMDRPYTFVCLTDRPRLLPAGLTTILVPSSAGLYGWWAKRHLFTPHATLAGRVLYLDLDTLVVGPLGPILDFPAPFALVPDGAPGWKPKNDHRAVVKRFNSSCMVWNAGEMDHLFADWTPDDAARLWGDQDLIGERCPEAATLPAEWFPRLSDALDGPPAGARVILSKKPKNAEASRKYPWFRAVWKAA
jgi:hypothetical protein